METVFRGKESHIANVKLMQLYFIDRLMLLKPAIRNEYLTDLLFKFLFCKASMNFIAAETVLFIFQFAMQ